MRYSPSTSSFYPEEINYPNPPGDLVETDKKFHQEWMNAPSGTRVAVAPNGRLSLVPPEGPGLEQLRAAKIRQLRQQHEASASQLTFTTAAGTQATFSNTPRDYENAQAALALGKKGWTAKLWLDARGNVVAPFTFADLTALSTAMAEAPAADHQALLQQLSDAMAAKTSEELEELGGHVV